MPSDEFTKLIDEKIDIFINSFTDSINIFKDENGRLYHAAEFGMYREQICRDFIKFFIPSNFGISTGFVINNHNERSTQCDIIIYDSTLTPIYEGNHKHRFFPAETIVAIGEVKSILTKKGLKDALKKLASNKALGQYVNEWRTYKKNGIGTHCNHIPTFLICQKLNFKINGDNVHDLIESLYNPEPYCHNFKHNLILSIEDGLILYANGQEGECCVPVFDKNGESLLLGHIMGTIENNTQNQFIKKFVKNLFLLTAGKTIFVPDMDQYIDYY